MGSDELYKRRKEQKQKRGSNFRDTLCSKWLIVCEGKETEVNYFRDAVNDINDNILINKKLNINIAGLGRNTMSLVKSVDNFINKVDYLSSNIVPYSKIFVVFDKDSFNDLVFDDAVNLCNKKGYIPLWSNQAFEYWFLLHFNLVQGRMHRKQYEIKINEYFKSRGLNYKYKKNDKDIYNKLCKYGSLENAINNAKKVHSSFDDIKPSKQESSTTVYKFFDEAYKLKE